MNSLVTRTRNALKSVALLATGDEIIYGDILNTNTQFIAQTLFDTGIDVGLHLTAPDHILQIKLSLQFLLQTHDAVIITGGLGPTSDDLTRFALSEVIGRPLIFNDVAWESILERFRSLLKTIPPENNKQQALFPEGATLIPNENGTASGCYLDHENKIIFMLPGPPGECLPLIKKIVIPELIENQFQEKLLKEKWFLFGASEGKIAEALDLICQNYACTTGYRLHYPYIEFKLHSQNNEDFKKIKSSIAPIIQPFLIADGKKIASDLLLDILNQQKFKISIFDNATGGLLEEKIRTPITTNFLKFSHTESADIHISGLQDYWEGKINSTQTNLDIYFLNTNTLKNYVIPMRKNNVKNYAVEFICIKLLEHFKKTFS